MISVHAFKNLVRRYRAAHKLEITNYAMNHNYLEYVRGAKTPLIEAMERHFGCKLDWVDNKPTIVDVIEPKAPVIPKTKFSDIDASVLPLDQNKKTKAKTNAFAYATDWKYFIETCRFHGQTLFWVKSHNCVCCECRYTDHRREIQEAVNRLVSSRQAA